MSSDYRLPNVTLNDLKSKFIAMFKSNSRTEIMKAINLISICDSSQAPIIPKYEEIVTEENFQYLFSYPALLPNRNLNDDRAIEYVKHVNHAFMMQNFWDNIGINFKVSKEATKDVKNDY